MGTRITSYSKKGGLESWNTCRYISWEVLLKFQEQAFIVQISYYRWKNAHKRCFIHDLLFTLSHWSSHYITSALTPKCFLICIISQWNVNTWTQSALCSPFCCFPAKHYGAHPVYNICTFAKASHWMGGLCVWLFLLLPCQWAATCCLEGIHPHFWRVDAVMLGAYHAWRQSPHNYAVHSNILM